MLGSDHSNSYSLLSSFLTLPTQLNHSLSINSIYCPHISSWFHYQSPPPFLMVGQAMKVHQMASVELWEQESSLSLTCKRLRPLAPKIGHHTLTLSLADLKSFIKPQSAPTKTSLPQSEVQTGGTRWNPTREQIEILEKLYRGGMRTPNAQQIEQITTQLGKYGKIEGKNVFYWFQNHKARERQRQKRVGLAGRPWPLPAELSIVGEEVGSYKRRSRPWVQVEGSMAAKEEEHGLVQTLELFPLRPEGAAS